MMRLELGSLFIKKWLRKTAQLLGLVCIFSSISLEAVQTSAPLNPYGLKYKQPNWRVEILETHEQGAPKRIVFYEPLVGERERPVKQVGFYENGAIQNEADISINEQGKVFLQGTSATFSPEGQLLHLAHYQNDMLEGPVKSFFKNGKLESQGSYASGKLEGIFQMFFEHGALREERHYKDGVLEGHCIRYYETGEKAMSLPYSEGVLEGVGVEWYASGVVKSERYFSNGQLHGNGKVPALTVYDEARNVVEAIDFQEGTPVGIHLKYYPNGREAYKVYYKEGKKEGIEQFFDEKGGLLGKGYFKAGVPVGKHFLNGTNQAPLFLAEFNEQGISIHPILEWNSSGQKIKEYSLKNEKLHGPYFEWYADGTLKVDHVYIDGLYEGDQKEYFPSGQLRIATQYKQGERHGIHEEWYPNGVLSLHMEFVCGKKQGKMGEWFSNGNRKTDVYFEQDQMDGVQTEWHENGRLKARAEFILGIKHGWQREWSEKEELLFEALFDRNQLEGPALSWWSQDRLKTRFYFVKGKKEGKQEWFHPNGQLERIAYYKSDLLDGEVKNWFADGCLQTSQIYRMNKPVGEHIVYFSKNEAESPYLFQHFQYDEEGRLHGEQKIYFPNQVMQSYLNYVQGHLEGVKKIQNEKGECLEEAYFVNGKLEGKYFQKGPNGQELIFHFKKGLKEGAHYAFYPPNSKGEKIRSLEAYFQDDLLQGVVFEYNEKGQKIASTPYVDGKKEGIAYLYTPEEKLYVSICFKGDQKEGLMTQYFPNGAVHKKVEFHQDLREGNEICYHLDGSIASISCYKEDLLDGESKSWNEQGVLVFEAEYEKGQKHGKFYKYYENGAPYIQQEFAYDELQGVKKKYDVKGKLVVSK